MATQSLALEPSTRGISQSLPDLNSSKRHPDSEILTDTPRDNIHEDNTADTVDDTHDSQGDPTQLNHDMQDHSNSKEDIHTHMKEDTITDDSDHVYDDIIVQRETGRLPDQQPPDSENNKIDITKIPAYENLPTNADKKAVYGNACIIAQYESESKNIADEKKSTSYSVSGLCCFAVMLMAVASLTVGGAGMGGYAVYTVHSENTALKEQLLQLSQMPLTDDRALEISRGLDQQLANFGARMDNLELQLDTNTQAIEEQKTVLAELKEDSERFHNETRLIFAKLSTELNKSRVQVEQLQQELTLTVSTVSELSHKLNYTQEQVMELNSTTHTLKEQLNHTQREIEQLMLQVTREDNRIRSEVSVVHSTQLNNTDELQKDIEQLTLQFMREDAQIRSEVSVVHSTLLNKTHEIQNDITKELVEIRGNLNITKEMIAADIASVNSTMLEFSVMFQENLNSLSVGLDTQSNQNTLQLQTIHANLSERITLNEVNIEELSKKQAKSTRKLTNELNQLSIQTQDSLFALEDSLTLASNVSTHSLNTLRNELLQEMDTNRNELSLQLTYTQKQVDELNSTAHLLTEQLNLTEKDIEQLTLHVTREDAQIRSEVSVVHSTLLNKIHEIQNDITKELVEIRGNLNITNEMLAADIASVNSTLLDFSVMFQENLNSLSVGLDTQSNQNTLQLQTIHANLSEQITLNEVHIEALSENQTNSNQKLTTELHQLSI